MTKKEIEERKFRPARQEADDARKAIETPQTSSAAYKLAFQDNEFLLREDLRPVRFQLELLKPQLLMDEARIESTFVFYGSARIPDLLTAPSSAGPAAPAPTSRKSLQPKAISPLVPMSRNSAGSVLVSRSVIKRPEVMSPPR